MEIRAFAPCLSLALIAALTVGCANNPSSPSATASPTSTATPSSTSTNAATATYTFTATMTPTSTVTSTPTDSMTATPSPTHTGTSTPTDTPTVTSTPTWTFSPTLTFTDTPTGTPTSTATVTPTASFTVTRDHTSQPTHTPTPTASGTQIVFTPTVTPSPYPAAAWGYFATLGQQGTALTNGSNGYFQLPTGVAVGYGYIAISDEGFENVQVFDHNGNYLYSIPPHNSVSPDLYGMTMDSYGELYVCDAGNHEVDGYLLGPTGYTYDYTWSGQGTLGPAHGVRIDADGNLVVVDDVDGAFNLNWSDDSVLARSTGDPSGETSYDLALDSSGSFYIADQFNSRVNQYSSSYAYTGSLNWSGAGGLAYVLSLATDSQNNLWVSDYFHGRVIYSDPQGNYLGEVNGFADPEFIALDSADDLFVVDTSSYHVVEYIR